MSKRRVGKCGKVCYRSVRDAREHLQRMRFDPRCAHPETLGVYECPTCKGKDGRPLFHIGNREPKA